MATRGVRVRLAAVFWRAAALVFVSRQFVLLGAVLTLRSPKARLWTYYCGKVGTQRSFYYALAAGAAVALLSDLIAKLLVGPLVRSWLTPPVDGAEVHFHLEPGERVVYQTPARRRVRGRWPVGTFAVTDRRIGFFPSDGADETMSLSHGTPIVTALVPHLLARLGFCDGVPERLVVRPVGRGAEVFALADPRSALSRVRTQAAVPPSRS